MKFYTITQLRQIARDQKYKLAALQNSDGIRKQPFNTLKKRIDDQLSTIKHRIDSDVLPDGIYYVCMSQTINGTRDPDKFAIKKGKVNEEQIQNTKEIVVLNDKSDNALTYESALAYQKEISDLKVKIAEQNMRIEQLLDQVYELESEGLEEGEGKTGFDINQGIKFLGEQLPALIPYLDKHFDLKEKELDFKIDQAKKKPEKKETDSKRIQIVTGSQEHLNLIENLYNAQDEERLNKELDKLEAVNPEMYAQVMSRLDLEQGQGEEEQQ